MKALVTGATGFVGRHLVDRLVARGDRVTALVRSEARGAPLAALGVAMVQGDLANRPALVRAATGQDVVFHLAARTGARTEQALVAANRDGTANLVAACQATGGISRFILISSMAAGGPSERGTPRTEEGPDRPVTWYGRSKLASEVAVSSSGLAWTALRPPTIYGPGDRDNLLAIFRAARFGVTPVFGDDRQEVSLIHVADLVTAITAAADSTATVSRRFYVNHPEVVTTGALVRAIGRQMGKSVRVLPLPAWVARAALNLTSAGAALLGRETILHPDKANEFFQPAWTADPTAFMTATGWTPTFDMASGLADTLAWYRTARWL